MKISVTSFVYFNYSLEEAVRRIAQAGYDGVDIWGGRPHAYRHDLSSDEIDQLRSLLANLNLAVPSFIPAQFRYPSCLCSPNEIIRQDSVKYIQAGIETASALAIPIVSVCPGHSLFGQGEEDAWGRLSESVTTICEYAAPYDVRIALEPADRYETYIMNTTVDAMRMIDELGYASLGILLDTGHGHVVGESAIEAVRAIGDRLFHVHVDDNNGLRDEHLIPGDGSFDFEGFIDALEEVGYDGFLSAELSWDYTIDPDSAVQLTAQRLHQLLKAT